jgi:predicted enzyme related to lactoylglutathione lyase
MKIDYLEFSSPDLPATKQFFSAAFGWSFNDYGPDYQEIADAGVSGGIAAAPLAPSKSVSAQHGPWHGGR